MPASSQERWSKRDDLFSIEGKTALVTGGSSGIGYMIARGLAERGAHVFIASRNAMRGQEVAGDLARVGSCTALEVDLAQGRSIQSLADELSRRGKPLNILVNNAGSLHAEPVDTFTEASWDTDMHVNVKAAFFLTQTLLTQLRAAATAIDPARIINVGSVGGLHVSDVENYAYTASKAALHHLTRSLARRLGRENITVNAVAPGPFPSAMMGTMLADPEAAREAIERHIPRGRLGEPEDIAGTVIFLCSRAGAYISGTTIPVDGGIIGSL